MNTILVPTDFSPAAQQAAAYAAQLAGQLNANVLLLHVYQMPVPMTDYPVLMVTHDDIKKGVEEGLIRAKQEAEKAYPGVRFNVESRLGDVATEIEEACKEQNPFAIVMGTKDLSGFERFLFGDTTASLIRDSSYPVIAIPEGATAGVPRNIVLATDLLNAEEIPAANIASIAGLLNATLHVVHVEQSESKRHPDDLMNAFTHIHAVYHAIREDDVAEGIKQFVDQNGIDLVVVLPHKHNLYERLFFKGHTQGILQAMPVPVMCLRND